MVSSLNRLNYTMPIELESFKESGSIEYTLDVVWGLELSILSDLKMQTAELWSGSAVCKQHGGGP